MRPSSRFSPSTLKIDVIFLCSMICSAADASSPLSIVTGSVFIESAAVFFRSSSSFCKSRRRSPSEITPTSRAPSVTTAVIPKPFFDIS